MSKYTTSWKRLGAVEDTDVVQAKETAFEDVVPALVLAVDPPREVQKQLLENPLEERNVLPAVQLALYLEYTERRPEQRVEITAPEHLNGGHTMHVLAGSRR